MSETNPQHAAIDMLARRDHSEKEMRTKLKRKGIDAETIDSVVEWLYGKKLLDDRVFAEKRAASLFRTKLVGPRWIDAKLREAGISEDIIHDVLESLASSEEWSERAKEAIVAWKRLHPKHAEDTVRHMRFLASRGFTGL